MRKRIGFVVPFDFALDREYWDYASTEASLHITRTPFRAGLVSPELISAVSDPAVVAVEVMRSGSGHAATRFTADDGCGARRR